MKKTLIIGASTNPARYAFLAAHRLLNSGHPIVLVGIKEGEIAGVKIHTDLPQFDDIDTITLYVGPKHQAQYYDYIIGLKPKRVIFNPGAENIVFEQMLEQHGIEALEACTLVMLAAHSY